MTLGIVEDLLACRKSGHNWGLGAGIITPITEGQTQTCERCKASRERHNGRVYYYSPPALTQYPRGKVE